MTTEHKTKLKIADCPNAALLSEAVQGYIPAGSKKRVRQQYLDAIALFTTGDAKTRRAAAQAVGISEAAFYVFLNSPNGKDALNHVKTMFKNAAGDIAYQSLVQLATQRSNLSTAMRATERLAEIAQLMPEKNVTINHTVSENVRFLAVVHPDARKICADDDSKLIEGTATSDGGFSGNPSPRRKAIEF